MDWWADWYKCAMVRSEFRVRNNNGMGCDEKLEIRFCVFANMSERSGVSTLWKYSDYSVFQESIEFWLRR